MRALAVLLLLVSGIGRAHADDTFEAKAAAARPLAHLEDLVWALTAPCDKGDDAEQRQCRGTRDRRAKELTAQPLLVRADAEAFAPGEYVPAKKSVAVTLHGCIRCKRIASDGKTFYVTAGAPKIEDRAVHGAPLYDTARTFQTPETAGAWLKAVAHHRVELVVKVPEKARWKDGAFEGVQLDVLGYRVTTPCNGTVVLASPQSGNAPPDKAACAEGGAAVVALTPELVSEAMQAPLSVMKVCAKKERASGKGKLQLTIADDGSLAAYEQQGDFLGTPMGKCIDDAMKGVTFPRSAKPRTKIGFPIAFP